MVTRKRVPDDIQAKVLLLSRRRCTICYGISRDSAVKRGQIAHIDHENTNNKLDNLAFLCLVHHDEYDTTTRQSKGLTKLEVKAMREELYESIEAALDAPITLTAEFEFESKWDGLYRWGNSNASAEIEISESVKGSFQVRGLAFWGIDRELGPNLCDFDCVSKIDGQRLLVHDELTDLEIVLHQKGITVVEHNISAGLNVTFAGAYERVPKGTETIPQAPPVVFESEFWPEEGIPEFNAKRETIQLYTLPDANSDSAGSITVQPEDKIQFDAFRYRTIRPGRLRAIKKSELKGRNLGQLLYVSSDTYYGGTGAPITAHFEVGDTIEYLQYRAEGTGFFRWRGLVIDADLSNIGSEGSFRTIVHPVAEGWIRINGPKGKAWVNVDQELIEISRKF